MKRMKALNLSPVRSLKQEREKSIFDDADDDATLEDINNLLSMPLPSLSSKFLIPADPKDEFLRLTTMVRAVYFSYLHKCLLSNYILCYKEKNKAIACDKLKKCADEMELTAVRSALAASLYRQNMLKMISDIKSHTSQKKAYKKLEVFLETQPDKIDAAVQTNNTWAELEKLDNIQSVCITSNCEELSSFIETYTQNKEEKVDDKCIPQNVSPHSTFDKTASPTVNSTSFHEIESIKFLNESDEDAANKMIVEDVQEHPTEILEILTDTQPAENFDTQITNNQSCIYNDDENSQDSVLQHMEDMFCESDDSSDLTKLIEKHSGVSKANIDKEINKMCLESNSFLPPSINNSNRLSENKNVGNLNSTHNNVTNTGNINSGKLSYSDYKEMKNRSTNNPVVSEPETVEMKQKRRASGIWFVERVHQVSKLKALITELSLRNYRMHGRVKQKFIELFGDSDDEEMMPDSPICIEEHLTACKERIAPWIVNHLMPFYKKRRIKDRQLFKAVAKHITDMLIIENTFPEEDCVSKYIENYFKNKKLIKTKQDIYL